MNSRLVSKECIALVLLAIFAGNIASATEQLYRTYNTEDLDSDVWWGGFMESTTPSIPAQRNELPLDVADEIGGEHFNPDATDDGGPVDYLDNNLDGDIDGDSPSAPMLAVYDFAIEIPGNNIDDNGDFQTDETPSPSNPIGTGIVKTMASGETLKLGFRAVEAYTTLQAFPTGAAINGGFDPLVPANNSSFSDFYGNIEWTAGDPGIWTFRIFAFNGAGIDSKEFMVEVLPANQPDVIVGASAGSGFGNGIYNATGAQQTLNLTSRKAQTRRAFYTLENDGALDDLFTVGSRKGNSSFKVTYSTNSSENITAQIVAGTYSTNLLSSGQSEVISSIVKPQRSKLIKKQNGKRKTKWKKRTFAQLLRAYSQGNAPPSDACKFIVRHR